MTMVEAFFWGCLAVMFYHFAGYPLVVHLLSRLPAARHRVVTPSDWPSVDLIIAAYNEEAVIAGKIRNALSLDYPADRYRIVVVADGSTDRTPDIVASFANAGVVGLHDPQRRGKSHALNRAVALSSADVVVLSDANNDYAGDAIRRLVASLMQPGVGGVTGAKRIVADASRAASTGDSLYWRYESHIKSAESLIGGTVTGDGEIFAIRRAMYREIPPDIINDDMYLSLRIVEDGYRVLYEPDAIAMEQASLTIAEDFNVKARMIAGGLQLVVREWRAMFTNGWFSVRFFSHKILRWTMPLFLAGAALANMLLLDMPLYRLLFAAQIGFVALAGIGAWLQRRGHAGLLFYVPCYFLAMNAAAAAGMLRFVRGRHTTLWTKARR